VDRRADSRIDACKPRDVLVACSALSSFVRDRLRAGVVESLHFMLLSADPAIIHERLAERPRRPLDAVCADVVRCVRSIAEVR
jgi:gluconate kinase